MISVHVTLHGDAVIAAATRGRRGLGEWRVSRTPDRLADDLAALLREIPRARLWRPRVVVAVSPPDVHVKRLEGLPPVKNAEVLRKLVEQQPARFFIGSATPSRVTVTSIGSDTFAAKYDGVVVDAIQAACANAKVVLRAIAPNADAAAAVSGNDLSALAWHPLSSTQWSGAVARAAGVVACFICALWAASAKGIRATIEQRSADAFIASIGQSARPLDSADAALRRAQAIDAEVKRFKAGRRSVVELLGNLSVSLPESTAVESLRADSSGALLTVVSTDVSDVVNALLDEPYFSSVQLHGRVAEEASRGARLQRSTLRLITRLSAARGRQHR